MVGQAFLDSGLRPESRVDVRLDDRVGVQSKGDSSVLLTA